MFSRDLFEVSEVNQFVNIFVQNSIQSTRLSLTNFPLVFFSYNNENLFFTSDNVDERIVNEIYERSEWEICMIEKKDNFSEGSCALLLEYSIQTFSRSPAGDFAEELCGISDKNRITNHQDWTHHNIREQ